jgi:hypothetical protein
MRSRRKVVIAQLLELREHRIDVAFQAPAVQVGVVGVG